MNEVFSKSPASTASPRALPRPSFDFSALRREPDVDDDTLLAYDATDELLLARAAPLISGLSPGEIVVIGDRHGALTLGALALGALCFDAQAIGAKPVGARTTDAASREHSPSGELAATIRVHQDPLLGELALAQNAERLGGMGGFTNRALASELFAATPVPTHGSGEISAGTSPANASPSSTYPSSTHPSSTCPANSSPVSPHSAAKLVLLQLPRGLDALDEIAQAIARFAHPDVVVLAGGRVKHMTLAMNDVLRRSFGDVTAGLATRKSRVLTARAPRPATELGPARFPRWGSDHDLDFSIAAYGATFGGPTLDHGTRLLLQALKDEQQNTTPPPGESLRAEPRRIVDLGCGNGTIATFLALSHPDALIHATDQSAAAVLAARETALAAGVADRVTVHRADATDGVPEGWADLIVLNPPFHTGATVHAGVAHRLIRAAAPALAQGGELWVVFNTHLGYRALIERVIGPTRQVARDRTFTVVAAMKRSEIQALGVNN